MTKNMLEKETSPYLLQHKDNPVHWRTWGAEALAEAKNSNKPILLSIGYSSCHWCHVMARESFQDRETAQIMNDSFINIKVDREERPDIDSIYQTALALMGQQGGWPLTMFCASDGKPFIGGTYFPKENGFGRPSFKEVLKSIIKIYTQEPEKIKINKQAVLKAIEAQQQNSGSISINKNTIDEIATYLISKHYDTVDGGFGSAPKFPQISMCKFLWTVYLKTQNNNIGKAITHTMDKISWGGIYDHLSGGFARYTVDKEWLIPHFEKMLYDNAQIIEMLIYVWRDKQNNLFKERIYQSIEWCIRDMLTTNGVFGSSYNADSDGVEGKFYVWNESEIDEILGENSSLFKKVYGISKEGNWEGTNILNMLEHKITTPDEKKVLVHCRDLLLKMRNKRTSPSYDDKVLADWNGMMIYTLLLAGNIFENRDWIRIAKDGFDFIVKNMFINDHLYHAWCNNIAKHDANIDDYANLIRAAILFTQTKDAQYIAIAEKLYKITEDEFWDNNKKGFFFTSNKTKNLITRVKTCMDASTPCGNGVMLENSIKLFYLTDKKHYLERANSIIQAFSGDLKNKFMGMMSFLDAYALYLNPIEITLIKGNDQNAKRFIAIINKTNVPNKIFTIIDEWKNMTKRWQNIAHNSLNTAKNKTTVYICKNNTCSLPIDTEEELIKTLNVRH